jgi:large subunit ribosomal protein L17
MLSNLSTSVLRHKKVKTTVAKAKEVRMLVEKLITRAKNTLGNENAAVGVHARRMVGRYVKDRAVVKELFTEIAPKVAERPGGYTRVVKLGQRWGDGGEVAFVELVDYNTGQAAPKKTVEKPKAEKKKKEAEAAS